MLRVENKDPVVRSRRTKESVEVDDDLGRKRGGAGGMKDSQPGIIVHDQGILRERFGTVRAAFRETLNPCPKALFVVEDEHMAFSYTNSWKLARSATSLALLKKSVRNGQGADKGLCQLDGSIRVNHVTVHTPPTSGVFANLNTPMYLVINVRASQKAQSMNTGFLQMN